MKLFSLMTCATLAFVQPVFSATHSEMFPDIHAQLNEDWQAALDSLDFQQTTVFLADGKIKLDVPEGFYFLDQDDTQFILTEAWGNPPGVPELGMIFPVSYSPLASESWGMTIEYEDIGYVSDEDAADYDYDDLLKTLQADTEESNAWNIENGYETVDLIGWAAEPYYNQEQRSLYWAKELMFSGSDIATLNYDIRVLGRQGVMVFRFIADIDSLDEINAAVPVALDMAAFTPGNTYDEFDSSIDKVAAVGIGGLIAGKVLAKTGFLVVLLTLLKKFGVLLLLPLLGLKRLFAKKSA